MNKRIIALTTAAALVAAPAAVLVAAPAQADGPERHAHGMVGGASYDMSAEKERGFEVSADLEGVSAGSTWKVVVKHDGKKIGTQSLRAVPDDGRYEVDFRDFRSANTAGKDVFTVKIKRVDGAGAVTRKLTFAR